MPGADHADRFVEPSLEKPFPRTHMGRELRSHSRRKLLAYIRSTQPNCHLCGRLIDLGLDAQRHPLASCGDELVPRSRGGSPIDAGNVAHAHRLCNGIRGAKPITPALRQRCRDAVDAASSAQILRRSW